MKQVSIGIEFDGYEGEAASLVPEQYPERIGIVFKDFSGRKLRLGELIRYDIPEWNKYHEYKYKLNASLLTDGYKLDGPRQQLAQDIRGLSGQRCETRPDRAIKQAGTTILHLYAQYYERQSKLPVRTDPPYLQAMKKIGLATPDWGGCGEACCRHLLKGRGECSLKTTNTQEVMRANPGTGLGTKDERKAECPYCHKPLAKVPGRKTKCPHCGEFMFVRTRPKDEARVVVTKEEADEITKEWAILNGTYDALVAEQEAFEQEKEILREKLGGREPSDNEVNWNLINKELLKESDAGNWGAWSSTKFKLGDILYSEMKLIEALRIYLEVCYLYLNGPNNTGGMSSDFVPAFDPSGVNAFVAPGIINRVQRIVKKLDANEEVVRKEFLEHNSPIEKSMNLPIAPTECWDRIKREIWS